MKPRRRRTRMKVLLEMTSPQVEEVLKKTDTAVVIVSTSEAHGPHLPLGTDIWEGMEVVKRAGEILETRGIEFVIAPTIQYGVGRLLKPFPGTITIQPETLINLVVDVCSELVRLGFKKVALFSFHLEPAHIETLQEAAAKARRATGAEVAILSWVKEVYPLVFHPWFKEVLRSDRPDWDWHAAELETSFALSYCPQLLDVEKWLRLKPILLDLMKLRYETFKDIPEGGLGYLGDPTRASKETWEKFLQLAGKSLAEDIEKLSKK